MPETAQQAAPPAPHQIQAFNAEKLEARIMGYVGLGIALLGAALPAFTTVLGANAPFVVVAGAIIKAAAQIRLGMAHGSFQAATDNP